MDQLSLYGFDTTVAWVGVNSATVAPGSFRCDNPAVFAPQSIPSGCVFPGIDTFQRFSKSDREVAQAADHLATALTNPDATLPPGTAKIIPGSLITGPLTGPLTVRSSGRTGVRPAGLA